MLSTQISQRVANSKISPHKGKIVSGIVPEPVIAAACRAEENDERPEDRSSLPEPIFYEQPYVHLSSALVGIYLARARVPLRRVYTRR